MPAVQRFRSAFNGFNRNDVVQYIEYLTNHYQSQLQQLNTQLETAANAPADNDLQAQLDAALAKCAELEAKLAHTQQSGDGAELETYRRAEKAERMANERARQIYEKANAALAEATVKAEEAAKQVSAAADLAAQQLKAYEASVLEAKNTFQQTVDALYAICPEEL